MDKVHALSNTAQEFWVSPFPGHSQLTGSGLGMRLFIGLRIHSTSSLAVQLAT